MARSLPAAVWDEDRARRIASRVTALGLTQDADEVWYPDVDGTEGSVGLDVDAETQVIHRRVISGALLARLSGTVGVVRAPVGMLFHYEPGMAVRPGFARASVATEVREVTDTLAAYAPTDTSGAVVFTRASVATMAEETA